MKYCSKCLIPDTKPYISFDENGVCNACLAHERKNEYLTGIDWRVREKEFEELVMEAKSKKSKYYDAMVPVSGGKDSIAQVHRLQQCDLRILGVNVDYGIKTEIGWHNLYIVPKMGASLATYRPEQSLHRRLIKTGFEDFGDPDLLSHTLTYSYPMHLALQLKIPLVLWGENSAFEYGGDTNIAERNTINRVWFMKYAANKGDDARVVSKRYNIPFEKLRLYDFPDEIEQSDTRAVFMSYYFHWDSEEHLKIAQSHGFKTLNKPGEGTFRNYVGIDEKINRIHQYMKLLKYGYGRATDHACEDIRNGRISREQAKELVRNHDLTDLSDYYVNDFVEHIGITRSEFYDVLERYRNRDVWKKNPQGQWYIPDHLKD